MASTSHIPAHWSTTTPALGKQAEYTPARTLVLCCGHWQACIDEAYMLCAHCGVMYTPEGTELKQVLDGLIKWGQEFTNWIGENTIAERTASKK